jgi:membrane protease YdiL (CAAX protease family)
MPQPPIDPALELFEFGTLLLSVAACVNVTVMRRSGPVLPYEARRPVPWGAVGSILAVVFVLIAAFAAMVGERGGKSSGSSQPLEASTLVLAMVEQLFIVGGFLFVISLFTKATPRDLGLPANSRQFVRDVCVGAAACLAALAPVLMLQQIFLHLFFPEQTTSGHPLIKQLIETQPDRITMLLSGVFTVVVAPICEETAFRLLLQGWLERWEDERVGWRRKITSEMPNEPSATLGDDATVIRDEAAQPNTSTFDAGNAPIESDPPRRGIGGLPYGWFPILVSSAAFGMAHFGYGPEPIPLFLLALVLGYLYQRTHRIVPSIVTHALFNLFTMIVLWRMVYHHG